MARLPTPGSDDGAWGTILNEYLQQTHGADGMLKANTVGATALAASGSDGQVLTKDSTQSSGIKWAAAGSGGAAATGSSLGTIQLAGDLGGTAAAPTVPGLSAKAPLASPTLTGTVTVPTPANATDAATKGYVDTTWQAAPIYLTWNGSDYAPTGLKATTSRAKIFSGPTDPAGVSGVVLSAYDQWNQTS